MADSDNDALATALAQFNEGLEEQRAEERAQRAIDKAERKKQQAAAALKKVQADPNASADDKAAADATYREAVEEWNRRRSGGPDDADGAEAPDGPEAAAPGDTEAPDGAEAAGDAEATGDAKPEPEET